MGENTVPTSSSLNPWCDKLVGDERGGLDLKCLGLLPGGDKNGRGEVPMLNFMSSSDKPSFDNSGTEPSILGDVAEVLLCPSSPLPPSTLLFVSKLAEAKGGRPADKGLKFSGLVVARSGVGVLCSTLSMFM